MPAAITLIYLAVSLSSIHKKMLILKKIKVSMSACFLLSRFAAKGLDFVRSTFASKFLSARSLIMHPALRVVTAPTKNRI